MVRRLAWLTCLVLALLLPVSRRQQLTISVPLLCICGNAARWATGALAATPCPPTMSAGASPQVRSAELVGCLLLLFHGSLQRLIWQCCDVSGMLYTHAGWYAASANSNKKGTYDISACPSGTYASWFSTAQPTETWTADAADLASLAGLRDPVDPTQCTACVQDKWTSITGSTICLTCSVRAATGGLLPATGDKLAWACLYRM